MAKNTLIRNPDNNSPFTKLEVRILDDLYKLLKGEEFATSTDQHFFKLAEIKEIYGLNNKESMYIAALYQDNWVKSGNFDKIEKPIVPILKLYDVTYFQDVSAFRDINFMVYANSDHMADNASSYDFYIDKETFTEEMWDDPVELGDYQDVFDMNVELSKKKPSEFGRGFVRLESRNIIKKVLNEYRRKI